jgi:hypothetical protein
MKKWVVGLPAVLLAAVVLATATPVAAHEYQRGESDHPLRCVAYVLYPIGIACEYGCKRPMHWVVSQPYARIIFGHDSHLAVGEGGKPDLCARCRAKADVVECPGCHRLVRAPEKDYFTFK